MAVSKVVLNGNTLIDTTDKTVTAASMLSGVTALKNDGTTVTGNLASKTSSDLSVSGATVTAPAGVYSSAASASVASGSAGTPTATKGTVSNHSVSVTPSVTNTTGYITGGTKTGTAVTVTAAELESGTKSITSNGTNIDVTGYAAVDVSVSGGNITVEPLSVTQNGTYTAPSGKAYSPVSVSVSGGGGGVTEKQVNFIDYDGTILYSYTAQEANALTALPANPSHSGLTAQGWNWTLNQIKAQLTSIPDGKVWIGQMYITQSGDTEIDCTFDNADYLSPYLTIAINGSVNVDWGDNTTADTATGTSLTSMKYIGHTYAEVGQYTITISVNSGTYEFLNSSNAKPSVLSVYNTDSNRRYSRAYASCIDAIRLGASVNIGSEAFAYCYSLQSITIPNSVTSIGTYAFQYCFALQHVTIPAGVTSIANNTFQNCYSLQHIAIPDSVTSIGNYAFGTCRALQSITIPNSVTSIGTYVFQYCYAVQNITIPNSVTSIGNYAFTSCTSLQHITIPNSVTSISNYTFSNCTSLQSITIPDNVTSLGQYMFQTCYALQSITIPDGVNSIPIYAFSSCSALPSITIPDGVTSISSYAFQYCYSLQSITIPDSVTSIGTGAFSTCYSMEEYHIKPTTVPTGGSNMFSGISSGTVIYVPVASLDAYKTATNWSTYASYMQGE